MSIYAFITLLSIGVAGILYMSFRNHPKLAAINKFLGSLGLDPYHNPLAPKPRPAVTCLKCGTATLLGDKCCHDPIQMKTQNHIEY